MSVILYDLEAFAGGPRFSPNVMKARLCLSHKRVSFKSVPLTYSQLRHELAPRMGVERARLPVIELEDGRFIMDSWEIAVWLEQEYTDRSSLFAPAASASEASPSAAYESAVQQASFLAHGFGDPGYGRGLAWLPTFELSVAPLGDMLDDAGPDSDRKWHYKIEDAGDPSSWATWMQANRDGIIERSKAALQPVAAQLRGESRYLASSSRPGFLDYVLYGRYWMTQCVDSAVTALIWRESHAEVAAWLDRLEAEHGGVLAEVFEAQKCIGR